MATSFADRWTVLGTALPNPAHIRNARFAGAVWTCPAAEARAVVRGTGLDPAILGGRGLSALACVQYVDSDFGRYDEVALQVLVRGPGGRPGLYTAELPVTGEFTLHAGRQIWGLPKWRSRTESTFGGRHVRLRLWDGNIRVLAVAMDAGPLPLPAPLKVPLPAWSCRVDGADAGELLFGTLHLRGEGFRVRPGGTRISLGEHRMSELAERLGLAGPALCTVGSGSVRGQLGDFEVKMPAPGRRAG